MTGNEWDIRKIAAILVQSLIPSILPIDVTPRLRYYP